MLTSINVKFNIPFIGKSRIQRVVEYCKYSPNNRCRPLSCLLAVLAMFLANNLPLCSSWNKWNVSPFLLTAETAFNLVLRSSWIFVQLPGNYAAQLMSFFTYWKILPNLFDSSWLQWIVHGILANQTWRNILSE